MTLNIQNTLSKSLSVAGPLDQSAKNAFAAANQMVAGIKDVKPGAFFEIYNNLLTADSFSRLFSDGTDDNNNQDNAGFGTGSLQDIVGNIPGLSTNANANITRVEVSGDTGKVIFADGTSTSVPVVKATSATAK